MSATSTARAPRAPRPDLPGRRRPAATLAQKFPIFFAFGRGPIRFLTHEESIGATTAERIRSIWPFLVRTVLRFAATLRPRALANFDPEDILTDLYVTLCEKDDRWDPARGKYLTFAGTIVANELHAIRERAGTVQAPRNSSCRLREYERADADRPLAGPRATTLRDLRRVLADQEGLDPAVSAAAAGPAAADPTAALARREQLREDARTVRKLLLIGLSIEEAGVLGRVFGLFDQPALPVERVARAHRRSADRTRRALDAAVAKVRAHYAPQPAPE